MCSPMRQYQANMVPLNQGAPSFDKASEGMGHRVQTGKLWGEEAVKGKVVMQINIWQAMDLKSPRSRILSFNRQIIDDISIKILG